MTFHLRPINDYDLQYIRHINDLVQAYPCSPNELLSEFEQNNPFSRVATSEDGKVSAYLFVRKSGEDLEVMSLGVAPYAQRNGIAKAMLQELIAKKPQSSSVFLEVSENNVAAVSLYKSIGFQTLSIRQHYYKDGSNALVMKLNLAKP